MKKNNDEGAVENLAIVVETCPVDERRTMDRRQFLNASAATSTATILAGNAENAHAISAPDYSDYSKDPRPDVEAGSCTAGSLDGPVFHGFPVVCGPSPESLTVLQPLKRTATGYLEWSIQDDEWQRVDGGHAGLLPLAEHVLKFRLPQLPPGKNVKYRVVAHSIGWVKIHQFYHGEIKAGKRQASEQRSFRTLDPGATTTKFAVWNDTHENDETIAGLHSLTKEFEPDFLLWNGDQSNDCHFERDMAGQFLNPAGLSIAEAWPLAYVRGNHECRGPAALSLPDFTGSPDDQFYYGFRSGPVAALVMDTGEDKPDDHRNFGGMANYAAMQREQAEWLKKIVQEEWFVSAPHKILFSHIPLWFKHPRWPEGSFDGHKFCRELWAPILTKAGVKLVVSGHTHSYAWMPQSESQPIAQLVGGSPDKSSATLITGFADAKELRLKMSKLDGTVLNDIRVAAT